MLAQLKDKYPVIVRLLLYCNELCIGDLYKSQKLTYLPINKIIETKCGFVLDVITKLLKTKFCRLKPSTFETDKIYMVEIQGLRTASAEFGPDDMTDTDHSFVLMYEEGDWYIMDAYIGVKSLSIRKIDLGRLSQFMQLCQERVDWTQWNEMFECRTAIDDTVRFDCDITEYSYVPIDLCMFYQDLVNKSCNRLNTKGEGRSPGYLRVLNRKCNIGGCWKYLRSVSLV